MSKMIIYRPGGRAGEYAKLACNLYRGCGHKCVYCYVPLIKRTKRQDWKAYGPYQHVLDDLSYSARQLADSPDHVFLCFSCDPYQPLEKIHLITRKAIILLHEQRINVNLLTKGGALALRDLELFTPQDRFGVTLTVLDDAARRTWEPGAAPSAERIASLKKFHAHGIPTWVSLEPVLYPQHTIEIIKRTHTFVDEYKVGKLNYHWRAKEIDWPLFRRNVVEVLEKVGAKYYLKKDLVDAVHR